MDTQEAANLAQIENTRLSRRMVYTGYATLIVCTIGTAVAVWVAMRQPDASQTPPAGGGFMLMKWLPVILLGSSSLVVAAALLVVAFRQWRFKPLREANSRLEADLAKANSDFGKEQRARQLCAQNYERVERERNAVNDQLSDLRRNVALAEEAHKAELLGTNIKLRMTEEELETARRHAETERSRANSEAQDKAAHKIFRDRAESELANLDWLYALAKEQAQDISAHVTVSLVTYPHSGELQLTGTDLCILVGLAIKNESVFNISVEDKEITGHFGLKGVAFKENAGQLIDDFRPPLHGLKPKQQEILVLEQPLRQFEAEKIQKCLSDDDAKLVIKSLRIPISASNSAMRVEPKLLRMGNGEVLLKTLKRNTDNP
jgi:hypothetical protein